jgi:DNA-binding NtrC family response regulator
MKQWRIWIINLNTSADSTQTLCNILESSRSCFQTNFELVDFNCKDSSIDKLPNISPVEGDLILLVLQQAVSESLSRYICSLNSMAPVIAVLEPGEPSNLFRLIQLGVVDFILAPLTVLEVIVRIKRVIERHQAKNPVAQAHREEIGLQQLIGQNARFLEEMNKVTLLAQYDTSVLITGETGTGKELVAHAIHQLGKRARFPFVPVNCGAIPIDLIENEFFGHQRGAFTGASGKKEGLIQLASNGTLFLDEIDTLPPLAQIKLLRFLQHKEYRPLGSSRTLTADVRIISASNADLQQAVARREFRQDLYYRLNLIPINMLPLRERLDDIPILALHFLAQHSAKFNKSVSAFSPKALEKLIFYKWPGNVRELEHVIERAVFLCRGDIIQSDHIVLPQSKDAVYKEPFNDMKLKVIAQFEREYVQTLLTAYKGNITKAAKAACKERRTFWELIRKHKIDVQKIRVNNKPHKKLSSKQQGKRILNSEEIKDLDVSAICSSETDLQKA